MRAVPWCLQISAANKNGQSDRSGELERGELGQVVGDQRKNLNLP
jgi:hypothetical protein